MSLRPSRFLGPLKRFLAAGGLWRQWAAMTARHPDPTDATDETLTPQSLSRDLRARAAITAEAVAIFHAALGEVPPTVLTRWRTFFGRWAGRAADRVPRHLATLAGRYGTAASAAGSEQLLFALQTYYALIVNLVAGRLLGSHGDDLLPESPFSWYARALGGHSRVGRSAPGCHGPPADRRLNHGYRGRLRLVQAALRRSLPARCGTSLANTIRRIGWPTTCLIRSAMAASRPCGCWTRPAAPAPSWCQPCGSADRSPLSSLHSPLLSALT